MRQEIREALELAGEPRDLSREELMVLLDADKEESAVLCRLADEVRARFMGDEVHLRGIIEFSNFCSGNCLYCGLRRDNRELPRYRMSLGEILASARRATELGCRTVVLQSGEDRYYSAEMLGEIVFKIKEELDVAVTLSVGERSREDYALFRQAGADRYLLKHETSDPRLFNALRPGTSLEGRLQRLSWLRELGFQVGSGNMVGLPGQTLQTLAEDILLLRRLEVEMAGIGPFIPNPQTPLGHFPGGTLDLALKALAVARLVLPRTHLPATTATGTIDPQGRFKALQGGANVIMPNMTPTRYRASYRLYPGKTGTGDSPEESLAKAAGTVVGLGRRLGVGYGHFSEYK